MKPRTIIAALRATALVGMTSFVCAETPKIPGMEGTVKDATTEAATSAAKDAIDGTAQVPQIDIQNGLMAYYPFNGNANDNSQNRNNGKIFGAVLTFDRNGKPESAFEFNGINSHIYVPSSESLNFTTSLTITAWIKTSRALPFAGIIVRAPAKEPRNGYGLCVDDHQRVRADITWDHSRSINGVVVSEIKITDGRWHFVATTYDGEVAKLYIDGSYQGAKTYLQGADRNSEPLLIGWDRNTWLSHRHFEGIIDEVRLYNRVLNEEELRYLMTQL